MYRGYKINIGYQFFDKVDGPVFTNGFRRCIDQVESNYKAGVEDFNDVRALVREQLDKFIREDGYIDGVLIESSWFPTISADVFLSHSHADEKLAIAFAHWLNINFGIRTFIDSTVWRYALNLQKQLDNRYNIIEGTNTYKYAASNRVCSFVDMLLATALSKMIDRCECFMFLESSNSLIEPRHFNRETSSPWIYHELFQSKIIEKKQPRLL